MSSSRRVRGSASKRLDSPLGFELTKWHLFVVRTSVATSLSWVVCETATDTKDTAAYQSQTAWGEEDTNTSLCPKLRFGTHTLIASVWTVQSDCIAPQRRRWCLADRVECLFPSTTGGTALVTHTHTVYSCTLANMHSNSDNAPIIGWTERGGAKERDTEWGLCQHFLPYWLSILIH